MKFTTLVEALQHNSPGNQFIGYIESEGNEKQITYGTLYKRAQGILYHLQQQKIKPHDELIILVNSNEQFVDAYWAALLGGIVPVPLSLGANDIHKQKVLNVFQRLKNPFIYTTQKNLQRINAFAKAHNLDLTAFKKKTLFTNNIYDIDQPGIIYKSQPDDIALLQFSSGSTGQPKGVLLTHQNLLTNIEAVIKGSKNTTHDASLSWMPLTHDMGIIGFHLSPTVANANHYLMPTELFIRRPNLWLKIASEKKITVLASPNFGYQHLLKRFSPDKLGDIDLSHVRLIFNGAEPIDPNICRTFLERFAPFKLKSTCIFPVYGLAEASLAVSFSEPEQPLKSIHIDRHSLKIGKAVNICEKNKDSLELISVGKSIDQCEADIFSNNISLPEEHLGQIKIRGDNVTKGYYQNRELTKTIIDEHGWLDTGDLGFFHRGELYISGRIKDLIIINGQNFTAHDIEACIINSSVTETGKIAACGTRKTDAGTDDLIVFLENKGDIQQFIHKIKNINQQLSYYMGIVAAHIIPINRIPKTTSGKLQRFLLADAYSQGQYQSIINEMKSLAQSDTQSADHSKNNIEQELRTICHHHLEKQVAITDNIFDIGASSLILAQIYEDIDKKYPNKIDVNDIFNYPTVVELAAFLENKIKT